MIDEYIQDLMWTPVFPEDKKTKHTAGLGWLIPNYQKRIIVHNGSILGFASNINRFIEDRIIMILFCNINTVVRPDAIALEIASYYCPELAELSIQPLIS